MAERVKFIYALQAISHNSHHRAQTTARATSKSTFASAKRIYMLLALSNKYLQQPNKQNEQKGTYKLCLDAVAKKKEGTEGKACLYGH